MRDLYQRGSCINTISASLSPLTSCTTPDGRRALRHKHSWDAAWTLLLPSLSTPTPAALKPFTGWTLRGLRRTPSERRAQARNQPSHFIWNISFKPRSPKTPVMALSVAHIRNVCGTRGETGHIRYKCPSFKIPVVIPLLPPPLLLKRHIVQQASSAVSRQDRCPQCWIIWPQRRPWSIQLMCLLHWKRQEKFKGAFCGILKEELRGQAFHFTVLLSTNSGCWYVNV